MKTSVIEVEKWIGKVLGVESVTVNYAAGNATARYDENFFKIADIKAAVHQSPLQTCERTKAHTQPCLNQQ